MTQEKQLSPKDSHPVEITTTPYIETLKDFFRRDVNVHSEIMALLEDIGTSEQAGVVDKTIIFSTLGGCWQEVVIGKPRESTGKRGKEHRGYVMVEPELMRVAVQKLIQVGQARKAQGKGLSFKWLLSKWMNVKPDEYGVYSRLDDDDNRLTLYADSRGDILEIEQALVDCGWGEIETHRLQMFGGDVVRTPRRAGSSEFRDRAGKYWRSLNFNEVGGASEDSRGSGSGRPILKRSVPPAPASFYRELNAELATRMSSPSLSSGWQTITESQNAEQGAPPKQKLQWRKIS